MPMPVYVPAFACGQPMPAGPPLFVVVVVRVPADRPESDEPAATEEPVHLDFALALRRLRKAPFAIKTRKLYADALRRFEAWLDGRPADDAMLTAYLDELFDRGLSPSSAVLVVAAVARAALECARDGRECSEDPVGPATRERLERFRRDGAGRGPGQVRGLTWDEVERMCGLAEGDDDPRGKRDAAIVGVAADGLMRVSEVSGLNAGDVSFLSDGTAKAPIRRSKTDQYGRGGVAHIGAVATERLRSWMEAADVDRGPCSGRWTAGGVSPSGVSGRTRCAPRSSAGRPGRGSGAGCPATRCAPARRRGWPRRARRSSRYRRRAAGSRPRCLPTTCAARRRPGARWRGCAPPGKSRKKLLRRPKRRW